MIALALLFLLHVAHAGHFSCEIVNVQVQVEQNKPWVIRALVGQRPFNNLHALATDPAYRALYQKLGAEVLQGGAVQLSPPAELNPKLLKLGSGFTVQPVGGDIPLRPWLDLVVDRKLPVGDEHDLMTHALAVFLMPPEIAASFQAQVGTLLHIRDELKPPAPLQKLIDSRIRSLADSFETSTYAIGASLVNGKTREYVAEQYFTLLGISALRRAGAPMEVKGLDSVVLGDWKEMGFPSETEAEAFSASLLKLHERDKQADPRYETTVTKKSSLEAVQRHFSLVLAP